MSGQYEKSNLHRNRARNFGYISGFSKLSNGLLRKGRFDINIETRQNRHISNSDRQVSTSQSESNRIGYNIIKLKGFSNSEYRRILKFRNDNENENLGSSLKNEHYRNMRKESHSKNRNNRNGLSFLRLFNKLDSLRNRVFYDDNQPRSRTI